MTFYEYIGLLTYKMFYNTCNVDTVQVNFKYKRISLVLGDYREFSNRKTRLIAESQPA